jgi:hypothetical protein
LVYLGLENDGHPGLAELEAVAYVDADAEQDMLDELLRETILRSPVTQTLLHAVTIKAQMRRA